MIPAWIALALIAAMLSVAAARRFPIWNPIYFFGVLFALQIGAGFIFTRRLGMHVPLGFSLPLLGAYLLIVGLLFAYSIRDREIVTGSPRLEGQFALMTLTPGALRTFVLMLLLIAAHNTIVNLILIERWGTLPLFAFNQYRRGFAIATPGVVLPQDVSGPFSVSFFTVVAESLVIPAAVIYVALLYCPKAGAAPGRRFGLGSVPWWVHSLVGLILLNAAIVHRRNPLLLGLAIAVLLLYLLGRLSKRTLIAGAVILFISTVAFGHLRRGTDEFPAAQMLGLPPVAGNTLIYEPVVYIGAGIPNFLQYWSSDPRPTGGELLLSSLFPRPVDRLLGLEVNRTEMLRRVFEDGFLIPGQTFRTPWFEAFFDFGWIGVYALAFLFPTGVYWLYRRVLVGPGRATPSLAFFTLTKIIFLFPFIYLLLQLPFWITVAMAVLIDWRLVRSSRLADPHRTGETRP